VLGFIDIVARLLAATFGAAGDQENPSRSEVRVPDPFPGTMS